MTPQSSGVTLICELAEPEVEDSPRQTFYEATRRVDSVESNQLIDLSHGARTLSTISLHTEFEARLIWLTQNPKVLIVCKLLKKTDALSTFTNLF